MGLDQAKLHAYNAAWGGMALALGWLFALYALLAHTRQAQA